MYTILIVDDEQLERQALRFILEKHCPECRVVGEAGDGANAIRLAAETKPDIVLLDIRMPQMNGLEAAKGIRALLPGVCILMLTAFDEFNYAKQALTVGAVDYLLKPVRPEELLKALALVVEKIGVDRSRKEEEEHLRQSVEAARPFIQMSFVYDLISGNMGESANFQERARFLGLKAELRLALVVDVDDFKKLTVHASEMEKQMVKQKIYQEICRSAGDTAMVTPFGSDNVIILLGFVEDLTPEQAKLKAQKLATAIRETIRLNLNISITIGIGRYYDDSREIRKSYHEAVNAQRQRFYLGDSQIIHIEDVPFLGDMPFHYPFQHERLLLDKVRCGERKQAKAELRNLLEAIFAGKSSIETVKACVLELLIVLSRSAVEGGADLERLTLLNLECISLLNQCSSRNEVESWLIGSLDQFLDNMLENRSSMNTRVINKACEYITKNCQRNLPLEEVAQTVHLSPFYFSRLFKQEKGYNFVDFMTKVRIDKAKRMLQEPDYTVVRIAAEVGYQDASYFCRVFRQAMKMTPNQYRAQNRRQEEVTEREKEDGKKLTT